jgi:hypothetical protein
MVVNGNGNGGFLTTVFGFVSSAGSAAEQLVQAVGTVAGTTVAALAGEAVAVLSLGGDTDQQNQPVTVYRVWGGGSPPNGKYWTTLNPLSNTQNYRNLAGLPTENTGEYMTTGTLVEQTGVQYGTATGLPNGTTGGWPQVYVPNPTQQIIQDGVTPLGPPINISGH